MELNTQEATMIAYALNMLALSDDKGLVSAAELHDLSSRVIINSIKENK
jgi:hypothetical protein